MLNNDEDDDQNVLREEGKTESDEDDEEPTLMSRSKHFANQVILISAYQECDIVLYLLVEIWILAG